MTYHHRMSPHPSLLAVAFLPFALLAGCGSNVVAGTGGATSSSSSSGTGVTSSSGTGTTTGTGGSSPLACPTAEPAAGPCAGYPAGLTCTYGTQARVECRDKWVCSAGSWTTTKGICSMSTTCGTAPPTPATDCPMSGAVCSYDSTICICSQCPGGPCMAGPAQWSCAGPPTGASCPAIAPNAGTACTSEGVMCTYGFPCGGSGTLAQCTGGLWVWEALACPA